MRIAFVSTMDGAPWGGSEELWSRAAKILAEEGHQVTANVIAWPYEAPQLAALEAAGVTVLRRPASRRFSQRLFRRLGLKMDDGWLKRLRPELLVIAQGGNLDGVDWMRRAHFLGVPYVTLAQMADENSWPHPVLSDPAAEGYRNARRAFFVSRGNLRVTEMQIGASLPQGSVVYNPVNLPPGLNLPLPWPKETDGVFRLALVGRLAPAAKGQDVALQVLAMPKWRARPVELSFYGEGYFKPILERLLKMMDLPKVRLAGHAARIDDIWIAHHALLMPSRHEGLPLALIEAMLCGRPPLPRMLPATRS